MSTTHKPQEQGIVSIFVTMIMILVISLIVLAFAQVTRHNQREALDRQLSTQAYYAAETGVNDAVRQVEAGTITAENTDCTSLFAPSAAPLHNNYKLTADGQVAYTCLKVNPAPKTLVYQSLKINSGTVVPLVPTAGAVAYVGIKWTPSATPAVGASVAGCPAAGTFSTYTDWTAHCQYGVVQVDLTPTNGAVTAAGLTANTQTYYLKPTSAGLPVTVTGSSAAHIGTASCTATLCTAFIQTTGASQYYARVSMLYQDTATLTVCADSATPNCFTSASALNLTNAQIVVDATGRDQDELRRISVRTAPNPSSGSSPVNALQSTNPICKQITIAPTFYQDNCVHPDGSPTPIGP